MFEKYSNKYLTEKLNRKEQNLADLLADDVSDYLGDTMDFDEFSSMDQEEKEDVVNNALGKLSDKYYNDGDFDKDLDKLMNRKYKEVTSYIASQLSEGIEIINEARGAKSTEFTKPGKDGDIYFSKREGNAVAVRQGDILQSIYVYDGEVKLGKIQKTDKRWENMGEPSEKLLIDLKLKNVGGLATKETQTEDGKLIYKFLSESVNEAKDPVYKKGDKVLIQLTHKGGVGKFADSMSKSKNTEEARIVKRIKNKITGGYKYELSNYITVHPSEIVGLAESKVNERTNYRVYLDGDYEEHYTEDPRATKAKAIAQAKAMAKNHKGKIEVTSDEDINDVVWTNESLNEGQFSWMTHDSEAQIGSEATNRIHVYMFDNEGNSWEEKRYEGYGEFGGKDYYDLLARMNGYTEEDLKDKALLKKLRVVGKPEMRQIGIALAFDEKGVKPRNGKKVLYPALVTNPRYNWKRHNFEVEADSDPNQSWAVEDDYDDDDYGYYDESANESWELPRFEGFVNENENRVYGMFTDDQGKPTKLDKELLDIALKGLPSNIVKNIDAVEANGYGKSSHVSPPTVSKKGQSRGEIEYHTIGIGLLKPMGRNKITAITLGLRKRTSGPGTGYLYMKVAPDWRHNLGPDAEGAIEFWDDPASFLRKLYDEKFSNWF